VCEKAGAFFSKGGIEFICGHVVFGTGEIQAHGKLCGRRSEVLDDGGVLLGEFVDG
jgi:hypothetical protein